MAAIKKCFEQGKNTNEPVDRLFQEAALGVCMCVCACVCMHVCALCEYVCICMCVFMCVL